MIKNLMFKASVLIISFVLITPMLASAQSFNANANVNASVTAQIQVLMNQLKAIEAQLAMLTGAINASSSPQGWGNGIPNFGSMFPPGMPMMGTSTNMMGGGQEGCPSIARDLSIGSQGSDVSWLQQFLGGLGFFSASSTGFFGPLTAQAVANFQARFGVTASSTGTVGPITRNFLGNWCNHTGRGEGQGDVGSSTWPTMGHTGTSTWQTGSSTWQGGDEGDGHGNMGTSTWQGQGGENWNEGSSTNGMPPWSQGPNGNGGDGQWNQGSTTGYWMPPYMGTSTSPHCGGMVLFIMHTIIPGGMPEPCQ